MGISDNVANYIMNLLEEADGIAEIQRNELAGILGCVPSQINYVITSRFTPEHGYIVESRRGGGGFIRITRRRLSKSDLMMHIINSVGNRIDLGSIVAMTNNLTENEVITVEENRLIKAAVSERALISVPKEYRNELRAAIFKSMLLVTNL
jgi:Transcriptional repressor of class III stress genes